MNKIQKLRYSKQAAVVTGIVLLGSLTLLQQGTFAWLSSTDSRKNHAIPKWQQETKNTNLDAVFTARQSQVINMCLKEGRIPPRSIEDSSFPGSTLVETVHQILFCPVQKAGSTFWMKTLKAMTSQGRFTSPYQVRHQKKKEVQILQNFKISNTGDHKNWFMENAVSLLVVRDPYTKLFSAYVDKLYHPNYLFWRLTGQPIRNMMDGTDDCKCGHDISFSDFIKYIIYKLKHNDGSLNNHFTPIYKHCDPCKAKYDYIMKFENFKNDCYYILDKWNTRFQLNISFNDFEKETAQDIADTHIKISFSTMKQYATRCNIPVYNFLKRTWRFLQITGHIPKDIDLPFPNNENTKLITKGEVFNAVKDVLSRKTDWSHVKKQRREALVQAYQSVDHTDIEELRKLVKPDCAYFGYNDTPDYLFEKSDTTFNYFDGLSNS